MTAKQRVLLDAALIALGFGALVLGEVALLIAMAALTVVATGEVYRLTRAAGVAPAAIAGFAGAIALLVLAYAQGEDAPIYFPVVVAATLGAMFATMVARAGRREVTDGLAMSVLPVLGVALLSAYVIALRSTRDGFRVVLALTIMAIVNDLVSGLVDPRRGRRPLAPTVRPARTWEGLAAGAIATMAAAAIIGATADDAIAMSSALVLGALVSAAAPLGDLSRAMLERDLRAEGDASVAPRALVLRRVDGLLFAAPVFFYAFRVLER